MTIYNWIFIVISIASLIFISFSNFRENNISENTKSGQKEYGASISKQTDQGRTIRIDQGNYNENIEGNYYEGGEKQTLAEVASEIQALLKQLEQTYPTNSTSNQMMLAAKAIDRIESNPVFKQRVISTAQVEGLAALEKAIDHPASAFLVSAIKGWQEVK